MRNQLWLLCFLVTLFSCDSWHGARQMYLQKVWWGGRAVAVTVDPTNDDNVWVATESGGLFHSSNGGYGWQHIDALPQFDCFDVKISPTNPNVIVATFHCDLKKYNGGGIWISTDGGTKWSQPATSIAKDAAGADKRFSAYGIYFLPHTENVYVGTDSGYAFSPDLGVSWSYVNPAENKMKIKICSILALLSGKILTYGDFGIFVSDNGGATWAIALNQQSLGWEIPNALAVSPVNRNHFFFTNANNALFYSTDGGHWWMPIPADFAPVNGGSRQPFVKAVKSSSGLENEVDVYYSENAYLAKKKLIWKNGDYDLTYTWKMLLFHHTDPSDLAFAKDGFTPLYETDDGGVSKAPLDKDAVWDQVGNADSRFNALQVYNVKGVINSATGYHDMYFGTQDNDFWASNDLGNSWPAPCCVEGINVQGPLDNSTDKGKVTFTAKGNGKTVWYNAESLFGSNTPIPPPSDKAITDLIFVSPGKYFVFTRSTFGHNILSVTTNAGITWDSILTIPQWPYNYSKISGKVDNPDIITPCSSGLLRIENVFNGITNDEKPVSIPMPPGCLLGQIIKQFENTYCFGVDPSEPGFIIVPDVKTKQIFITSDSGAHWFPRPDLLDLVTNYGKYYMSIEPVNPQVTSIAFNPKNSKQILIGNAQSGVIYSDDHGDSWYRIKQTESFPYIYSFFFVDDRVAIASSFGRGLWKIRMEKPAALIRNERLDAERKRLKPIDGDKEEARRQMSDTLTPLMQLQDDENQFTHTLSSATKSKLIIYNWSTRDSVLITINGRKIKTQMQYLDSKTVVTELPPLYQPGLYTLSVYNKQYGKQDLYFTVVAVDNEREMPKPESKRKQ